MPKPVPKSLADPSIESLQVGAIVAQTTLEGPGTRFAIWLQGCPLRCPGCCNPQLLPFDGTTQMDISLVEARIRKEADAVEGLTILGGEPFAQAAGVCRLMENLGDLNLSLMLYSGFVIEDLRQDVLPHSGRLLALTDILVDGPYIEAKQSRDRAFVGSSNQRIHLLTKRYEGILETWPTKTGEVEIKLNAGGISIHGAPQDEIRALARQLRFLKPKSNTSEPS